MKRLRRKKLIKRKKDVLKRKKSRCRGSWRNIEIWERLRIKLIINLKVRLLRELCRERTIIKRRSVRDSCLWRTSNRTLS
jgi:hypothetical protein